MMGTAAAAEPRHFQAVLDSPGGPLPFGLRVAANGDGFILNGEERIPVAHLSLEEREIRVRFDHYASEIHVTRTEPGVYRGEWKKRSPTGWSKLGATLTEVPMKQADTLSRFESKSTATKPTRASSIAGDWAVTFLGSSGDEPSPGGARFEVRNGRALGTFFTPVGDYRYLEGDFQNGHLRLSCFDGAHAFLFHADLETDGTLAGHFWSRDSWHETWTAKKLPEGEKATSALPDPFSLTSIKEGSTLDFTFPDVEGRPVSLTDPRFRGKPLIVEIFGTWCPNCHDAAPVLREIKNKYKSTGLQILGLAYEITGDPALDAEQIRRYAERHGCDWPILLAGTSSKAKASKTLPALSGIKSYPTTIFIDRKGRIQKIYTGFNGPATGEDHEKLLRQWDDIVRRIVVTGNEQSRR